MDGAYTKDAQAEKIEQKIRDALLANVDQIAATLVEQAREGHLGSAQFLFQLGGVAIKGKKSEFAAADVPKMFLLDLLERLFCDGPSYDGPGRDQECSPSTGLLQG